MSRWSVAVWTAAGRGPDVYPPRRRVEHRVVLVSPLLTHYPAVSLEHIKNAVV